MSLATTDVPTILRKCPPCGDGLPYAVPVLTPDDLTVGINQCGRQRCLLGWRFQLFQAPLVDELVSDAIRAELASRGWRKALHQFNDEHPPEQACDLWAAIMRRLGYERDGGAFILPGASEPLRAGEA